eukprot:6208314-Pleurochrysis_carterae.AAC.1
MPSFRHQSSGTECDAPFNHAGLKKGILLGMMMAGAAAQVCLTCRLTCRQTVKSQTSIGTFCRVQRARKTRSALRNQCPQRREM